MSTALFLVRGIDLERQSGKDLGQGDHGFFLDLNHMGTLLLKLRGAPKDSWQSVEGLILCPGKQD